MSVNKSLAVNLKRYREQSQLTQEKLAELAGCSKNHLSAIERGKKFPGSSLIEKLCVILKIKPYELFLDESDLQSLSKQKNFIEYVMDSLNTKDLKNPLK